MFDGKRYWGAFWNFVTLVMIWIAATLFLGVVARAMKEVFCLGYGC